MTDVLADFFSASTPAIDQLREDLISMVRDKAAVAPRTLQVELGPSEIGHPCMRKIAYALMQAPRCNPEYDPLPSIIGTATHKWLEAAAEHANQLLGRERWLVETEVKVAEGLKGHADLYDCDTDTVIDWKVPGTNRFDKYRREMNTVYRRQAHFYGLGFENAGRPVKQVAIALLPRGGTLRNMHLWREDYDRDYALAGLRHYEQVIGLIDDLEVETNPARYEWIPMAPYDCLFCANFAPQPSNSYQCKGDA